MANLVNLVKTTPDNLSVWGNGTQTRDWVHVNDILKTIHWCISDNTKYRTVNIGTGQATSFLDLIQQIHKLVYDSECTTIKKLTNKPQGMMHRVADIELQTRLQINPTTPLIEGIKTLL